MSLVGSTPTGHPYFKKGELPCIRRPKERYS
jgi:hypothetical protein